MNPLPPFPAPLPLFASPCILLHSSRRADASPPTLTIHTHTTPGPQQSFAASTNVAAAAASAAGVDVPDAWTQDPVGPGGGGSGSGRLLGRRVVQRGRVVLLAREGLEAGSDDTAVVEWDGGGETEVPVSLLCFD